MMGCEERAPWKAASIVTEGTPTDKGSWRTTLWPETRQVNGTTRNTRMLFILQQFPCDAHMQSIMLYYL